MGSSAVSVAPKSELFSSLPKWQVPWTDLFLSYGTQAIVIATFVLIPILHPEILDPPKKDYHAIELVPTPVPVNHTPQRRLPDPPPVVVAQVDPPPSALRLTAPQPKPKPKPVEEAAAPEVKIADNKPEPVIPTKAPVMPKEGVKTNVFSGGSSAPQTTRLAASQVQTGGFGDPNGVPASLNTGKSPVNIAQAGGFDMPTGPGYGNGTGGAKGARGVVASTGFGGGVAVEPKSSGSRGAVQKTGFGDADVPAPTTVQSHQAAVAAKMTPAEILSKPTPIYTEEARASKVEGEVLLEVVFGASGRIQVLRVVRGLGHGLDESAVRAAQQIRFKPALKDGEPSDSTAILHIVFQIA